ncbi:hypothetical protein [Acidovorax sp. 69]|uniref:hypothetical protein n=1 Tax=Acidovorax sp. 69 TaxID=2035202 RepID=UPI0012FE084F|nr:hypothetical protein [Acidovorax sp. 69]
MLLPVFEPRMSDQARRIVRCAAHLHMFLSSPEKSAWFDAHVFEVEGLLRGYAIDYISQACQDLDAQAQASKDRAAGRGEGGQAQRRTPSPRASGGLTCK